MKQEIQRQILALELEQLRVKEFANSNHFDCTSAPWVIIKRYRDELKEHIETLKTNLEDLQ